MPRPCKQEKQFWVYGHYTDDGELFYVGKGTMYRAFNMRERNYIHKGVQKKHGCHVGIIWGPTYDEDEAYKKEELYVRELHTCVYDECRVKHAANLDWGGMGAATGIVRSKETGKLELKAFVPKHSSQEKQRIAELMRKDGRDEEEIEQFLKGE